MLFTALLAFFAASSGAEAAPPGLWFWGGGSPASLGPINKFTASLGPKSPQIFYSIGGCHLSISGIDCSSMNATHVKEMVAMKMQVHVIVGVTNITTLRAIFADPAPFISSSVKSLAAAGGVR
jgi:hypothetical protein